MKDVFQETLNNALALHKQARFNEAEALYNRLLNRFPFDESITFLLADLYLRKEHNGLAVNLLTNLVMRNPNHAAAWCNLGVGFRKENMYARAQSAWESAIAAGGETVEVCTNLATLYADRAEPRHALKWCRKALSIDPTSVEAKWQSALAHLTLREWGPGWEMYENRTQLANWDARAAIDAPRWDGSPVERLYIHGEQGVGDEVMFASMLPRVAASGCTHVTIEVNAAVAPIIRQTWPDWTVITDAWQANGAFDAKIPIASLCELYGSFNDQPYLQPDPARIEFYRAALRELGPGPYIAVTWMGGAKATRVEDRSFNLETLRPILDAYTCVSAQYTHTNPMLTPEREAAGLAQINDASTGLDLAEQAALFAAVDAVVTVQQTAVHVAGAVGARTFAMIGSHPHWRYGLDGDVLPWYESVRLIRQKSDWAAVVARTLNILKEELPC